MPTSDNLAYDCDHLSAIAFRPSESSNESINRAVPAGLMAMAMTAEFEGDGTIHAAIVRVDGTRLFQPIFSMVGFGSVAGRPGPLQACRDWFATHVPAELRGTFTIWEDTAA